MSFADKLKAALAIDGNVATYDLLYDRAAQIEAVVREAELVAESMTPELAWQRIDNLIKAIAALDKEST